MKKTKTIFKKINLNTDWIEVSLNKFNDFYLIAQRDKKGHRSDTISKDDVQRVRFEIGVRGFGKSILTIDYKTLNFGDFSSSDAETNSNTAVLKVLNYPSKFFIRPIEIIDVNNVSKKEGKTSIKVGVYALKLN